MRVADVTKPVEIELPGIAHRFAKGHRLRLVVTTANSTNRGNTLAGPVSIATDSANPGTLTLPRRRRLRLDAARPLPLAALADRPAQHRPHPARLHARTDPAPRPRPARAPHRSHLPLLRDRPQRGVTAVFSSRSRRGRVRLVTTTARGHGNRRVRVGSTSARFRRAYPRRRRVARGIFRASPRSPRLFGVRRGKVSFIAVRTQRCEAVGLRRRCGWRACAALAELSNRASRRPAT